VFGTQEQKRGSRTRFTCLLEPVTKNPKIEEGENTLIDHSDETPKIDEGKNTLTMEWRS